MSALVVAASISVIAGCGSQSATQAEHDATNPDTTATRATGQAVDDGRDDSEVRAAVEDYLEAVIAGDGDRACQNLTADAQAKVGDGSASDCASTVGNVADVIGDGSLEIVRSARVTKVEYSGDRAVADVVVDASGEQVHIPVRVDRVGSDWKLAHPDLPIGAPSGESPPTELAVDEAQAIVDAWAYGTPDLCDHATDQYLLGETGKAGAAGCEALRAYRTTMVDDIDDFHLTVTEVVNNEHGATVVAVIDGLTATNDYELVYDDGAWKIADMD